MFCLFCGICVILCVFYCFCSIVLCVFLLCCVVCRFTLANKPLIAQNRRHGNDALNYGLFQCFFISKKN